MSRRRSTSFFNSKYLFLVCWNKNGCSSKISLVASSFCALFCSVVAKEVSQSCTNVLELYFPLLIVDQVCVIVTLQKSEVALCLVLFDGHIPELFGAVLELSLY